MKSLISNIIEPLYTIPYVYTTYYVYELKLIDDVARPSGIDNISYKAKVINFLGTRSKWKYVEENEQDIS